VDLVKMVGIVAVARKIRKSALELILSLNL
jgi:hypothetical protein